MIESIGLVWGVGGWVVVGGWGVLGWVVVGGKVVLPTLETRYDLHHTR